MSREDPQLKVRLPQELKDKITESASKLGRSINADVVARLEETFDENKVTLNKGQLVDLLYDVEKITTNTKDQAKLIEDQSLIIENLNEVIGLVDQTTFHKTKLAKLLLEFSERDEYQIANSKTLEK
ncbi:Arc family DNA-binding protein [Acinetobacter bereziniae]|uniref:Arc family DNA-binding protein n=1 Tax=Acinetobacter bereziniae TaxID=106648 RepID=UPI0021D0D39E|nr:Arc family DNA-binding protein [Acinetobacter bereziniae]